MEQEMDLNNLLSGLIGAFIGGLLSLVGSRMAVKWTAKVSREADEENTRCVVDGFLHSIYAEIQSLFSRYQDSMGAAIENLGDGLPMLQVYIAEEDYFTVYNANASILTHVKDNDLRHAIVDMYIIAKSLLDTYRVNNVLLKKQELFFTKAVDTNDNRYIEMYQAVIHDLVAMGGGIKQMHRRTIEQYSTLISLMHAHGINAPDSLPPDDTCA